MKEPLNHNDDIDACSGCALHGSRRDFLRDSFAMAAGVLAVLGATRSAAALPIGWVEALAAHGTSMTYPVPNEDGAQIDREHEVILVRWQNAVYAFALSCPHQHTALRWLPEDARFQCPKHKSKYQPDGTFMSGRATRGMDRFSLQRETDHVIVDLAALHKQTTDPAGWDAAVIKLS